MHSPASSTYTSSNTYTSSTFTLSLKHLKLSLKLRASNIYGIISISSCSCQQQNRLQSTQYFRPR